MQETPAQRSNKTIHPPKYTLYSSIVGLLLSLGIAQGIPSESPEPQASPMERIIQQRQQLIEQPIAEAVGPQGTALKDLPNLKDKNLRVGIQIGHFENDNPPAELSWLKGNTGARGGGKWEKEVVQEIVLRAEKILERQGVEVDILPAIVPPAYTADAFISVHTDGSDTNADASGYKVAGARKDRTGKASRLSDHIGKAYAEATNLRHDANNITSNMTDYYSFNHERYEHSISTATPGALLETGFLTNESDRDMLINHPDIPALGLAQGILEYLAATH